MPAFFVNSNESIQAAINAASDGDIIIVAAGTYNESININKDVTLLSFDGAGSTIINGQGTNPGFSFAVQINANGATFGDTGQGFVYELRPAAWKQHACEVAGRVLTRREWELYLPGRAYAPACRSGGPKGLVTDPATGRIAAVARRSAALYARARQLTP